MRPIRFGDYLQEVSVRHVALEYRHVMPATERDARGRDLPYRAPRISLTGMDVYRLLAPYVSVRFMDQARAVVPLALYLAAFQLLILRHSIADAAVIGLGLLAVMLGLLLFMEGLKLGLMPFGETIGTMLPQKAHLPTVLGVAFLLGVGVTFAEPAVGALQIAGTIVDPVRAPYLHLLLTRWADALVLVAGLGVGLAAVIGTVRFIYGWSLKPLIYLTLGPTLLLTAYAQTHPDLRTLVGLAWDLGGVTTGPVTVPLVLALGIGVAAAVGKGNEPISGFGIVTLASLIPVMGVLLLGIAAVRLQSPEALEMMAAAPAAADAPVWYQTGAGGAVVGGARAILPLVLFLVLVLRLVLRERHANPGIVRYGLALSLVGMIVFNLGLTFGLSKLGDQSGSLVPGAFTRIDAMPDSPVYGFTTGVAAAAVFALVLGFSATLAEPALNALGLTVENLTNGVFRKSLLMYAVAVGVGLGITLGVLKVVFALNLATLLLPLYLLALGLTWFSNEEYVNIAWDSAGVTTGPVTVPLVLAMGLGFGRAVGAAEGFGILAGASVCPIISVMVVGLYARWRSRRERRRMARRSAIGAV